jgi:HlyD family secretion protein
MNIHYFKPEFTLRNPIWYLLIICSLFSCQQTVEKTKATRQKITESVYASGVIKSQNQYQVFSTVNGLVQKVFVKEGDLVKAGDPLFLIQNESSRLNTENARLATDFAQQNLNGDRLNELKGAIETAKGKWLNDSLLLIRQRDLWAQQIGSKVDLEQRELAYTNSLNTYKAAIFRYKDLQKQLGFSAAQSQKLLSISQNMTQDYLIRSQTSGRVYSLVKTIGEMVSPQSPIAIIGDADRFYIELQIDENDIVQIQKDQSVMLTMDSYKGQVFEAKIANINPLMNERTRTFLVEAHFVQQPALLYPNLSAEANIILKTKANALIIPRAYLLNDSMVLLTDKKEQKVRIGLKDYLQVEILDGLDSSTYILKPGK